MSHFANMQSCVIWHFQSTVNEDYSLMGHDALFSGISTDFPEKLAASICNVITDE